MLIHKVRVWLNIGPTKLLVCVVQGILDLEYMLDNLKNLYIIAFHYLPEYFPHTAI